MTQHALKLIEENKSTKATFLDLGHCGLDNELPQELFDCVWLEGLNLGSWFINNKNEKVETANDLNRNFFWGPELSELTALHNLKKLSLSSNQISDISFLSKLTNLTQLYLSYNQISDISFLSNLTSLTQLDLNSNQISDISFLSNLTSLTQLNLRSNQISDISFLSNLTSLTQLDLRSNKISDISFLSKLTSLTQLDLSSNKISDFSFLSNLTSLTQLYLNSNQISDFSFLSNLTSLTQLDLSSNKISDISFLSNLTSLTQLYLSFNEISDISFLSNLTSLTQLYLSFNEISDISFLSNLTSLTQVYLSYNYISDISFLSKLTSLTQVDLRDNQISDISFLSKLTSLTQVDLSYNQISDISFLSKLTSLTQLYLSSNQISDISPIESLSNLNILRIDNNPFEKQYQIELQTFQNHLPQIKNIIERQKEKNKKKIKLPAKVLLLGNHRSGKSSLLYYLQENKINYSGDSTHLLEVELYPANTEEETKAILYDFGGQDYYHGLYRVFLSSGSIYLLLWQTETNLNDRQENDANKQGNLNFDVNYWLGQKAHLESEKLEILNLEEKKNKKDPLLLIQTYAQANESPKQVGNAEDESIKNRFYVSFSDEKTPLPASNVFALQYLKSEIESLIENNRYEIEEAVWYIEFYNYVINAEGDVAVPIEDLLTYYTPSNKTKEEKIASLKIELQQFHYQGLVLYYPNINANIVWLNPAGLVKYVHENILQFNKIKENKGIVLKEQFDNVDTNILALLKEQKVIFEHQYGENGVEYIIPNYLALVKSDDTEYELFTFGLNNLAFVLRFKDFLPFGLINQMICFFGRLPDKKKFWRDQLLFTFEKSWKILIQLDFENLEIKVHAVSDPNQKQISEAEMISYLFYCIMAMYWDIQILDFKGFHHTRQYAKKPDEINRQSLDDELIKNDLSLAPIIECQQLFNEERLRPSDLLVSRNGIDFVDYKTLCEKSEDSVKITASRLVDDKEKSFEIPIKPYEVFTNKTFTKMKKIFISYSNQDIYFKKELEKYLQPFSQFKLAKSWSCEEITPGLWDEQIQSELESSDVIVFMLSINFVNSDYILKEEVLKTIKAVKENPNKKIVCVVVKNFPWQLFNKMADSVGISKADLEKISTSTDDEKKQEALLKLADYQFLPYFTEAKEKESKRYLHPLNKWQHEEDAYSQIAEKIMTVL